MHAEFVGVHRAEESPGLWGRVDVEEVVLLALSDQRVAIFVVVKVVVLDRLADSEGLVNWAEQRVLSL